MGVCSYCGESHPPRLCPQKFDREQFPLDLFGLVRVQVRKRSSDSPCVYCAEVIRPGSLEVVQVSRQRGRFVSTQRAHFTCWGAKLVLQRKRIELWKKEREEVRKQNNRVRSRERYRVSKTGERLCADS